jgi:predicted cobalt transporter CbtA
MVALPTNPDPITMPLDLVGQFRVYSLIGLTLFWAVLGLCFAWVATRTANIVPMQGAR